MQVNTATIVPFFPVVVGDGNAIKIPATPPEIDRALLHVSAQDFSGLVSDAKGFPDVRGELVNSYKSQIAKGTYPSEDTVSGLASLLSGSTH